MLTDLVSAYPWTIAIAFFLVSVLINSQGAVVVAMLPLAYTLKIEGWVLLGVLVIGKYLLNHSFMMPGLISVIVSTLVAYGLSYLCHTSGIF